jgi:acyl carrier protein
MQADQGERATKKPDQSQLPEKAIGQLGGKSDRLTFIARNLATVEQITRMIESRRQKQRSDQLSDYVAPKSELEKSICAIWQKVLGIEKIGIHDNFFKLGGQSLLGTRILSRVMQETGVALRLQHLFDAPTVASIADLVRTLQAGKREKPSPGVLSGGEREVIAF